MRYILCIVVVCTVVSSAFAQRQEDTGVYIDPEQADPNARRVMVVNSNQVETEVTNYGTVARGGQSPIGGIWPRGTGHDHIHEMSAIIGGQIINQNNDTTIIISDGYSEASEIDPQTNVLMKFHPLAGYVKIDERQEEIANSLNPTSWPDTWPGRASEWNGTWAGFFGLNQFNADQEVYYVMDDSWNTEFGLVPDAARPDREGMGLQVESRIFQWSHPLAKDILFNYFQVTNVGNISFNTGDTPIYFGGFADIGPGGRGTVDDDANFDEGTDMVYAWDCDNIGVWSRNREIPPGYMGWKFLESPGISTDNIDNDADGLLDEQRDNDAGSLVFGPIGNFGDPREHWSGDEDGDWFAEIDDVGSDGAGPLTEGYPGPDADGTEGNGQPDQGEPNFGFTDNDESDQIGLTSFASPLFGEVSAGDETMLWPRIQNGLFTAEQHCLNQLWIFGSGPFNIAGNQTERFSTCFVFGFTEQAIFQTASVAQRIFDADYRFARPPRQPELTAIPGDGQVVLTWDNLAEISRDPVYGFDFEGYRIFKSTDPQFLDAEDITDALGNPTFKEPLVQYDVANGLLGPHPLQFGETIGQPTGVHFYMGEDTGLQHYFVDDDVINGRTYYYAITSFDRGYVQGFFDQGLSALKNALPISPAESPASIRVVNGEIVAMDPNTAVATPNPLPSNLIPGTSDVARLQHASGVATGSVDVFISQSDLVEDADYVVTFKTEVVREDIEIETVSYTITDERSGEVVAEDVPIQKNLNTNVFLRRFSAEIFDKGFVLLFENEVPTRAAAQQNSAWSEESRSNIPVLVEPATLSAPRAPISAVIEIGASGEVLDSAFVDLFGRRLMPVNFRVSELGTGEPLDFLFIDRSSSGAVGELGVSDEVVFVYREEPTSRFFSFSWRIFMAPPVDAFNVELPEEEVVVPQDGDVFTMLNNIPFSERDRYRFTTRSQAVDESATSSILDEVKVVPNPYVVASVLEEQPFLRGRGERFIRFINVPIGSTIRIYTASGDFIRELQHDGFADGAVYWDLLTKDGLEIAFGLYLYHIEAPGIGEKTGQFAIVN
ncbi:MAG: hypothetical protein KTR29_16980 [Rhodothermaceae bacterium]|nr:hypothetical protein [Rhodothermaceae bacterium]